RGNRCRGQLCPRRQDLRRMSKHGPPQQQQREGGGDDNSGSHDGSDLTRLEVIRSVPGKETPKRISCRPNSARSTGSEAVTDSVFMPLKSLPRLTLSNPGFSYYTAGPAIGRIFLFNCSLVSLLMIRFQ